MSTGLLCPQTIFKFQEGRLDLFIIMVMSIFFQYVITYNMVFTPFLACSIPSNKEEEMRRGIGES